MVNIHILCVFKMVFNRTFHSLHCTSQKNHAWMSQLLKHKSYKSNFELCSKWILTKNLNPGFFSGVRERAGEGGRLGLGVAVQLWTLRGLSCCITNYCFNIMEQTNIANSEHKTLQSIISEQQLNQYISENCLSYSLTFSTEPWGIMKLFQRLVKLWSKHETLKIADKEF